MLLPQANYYLVLLAFSQSVTLLSDSRCSFRHRFGYLSPLEEASIFQVHSIAVDDSKSNKNKQSPLIAALSGCHRIHTHSWMGSFPVLLLHIKNRKTIRFCPLVQCCCRPDWIRSVSDMVLEQQEEENVAPLACVCLSAL